jgi:hypothetical protein
MIVVTGFEPNLTGMKKKMGYLHIESYLSIFEYF